MLPVATDSTPLDPFNLFFFFLFHFWGIARNFNNANDDEAAAAGGGGLDARRDIHSYFNISACSRREYIALRIFALVPPKRSKHNEVLQWLSDRRCCRDIGTRCVGFRSSIDIIIAPSSIPCFGVLQW